MAAASPRVDDGVLVDVSADAPPAGWEGIRALERPLRLRGEVVHGFGRGSKELGVPTANICAESIAADIADVPAGIYLGWASVNGEGRHKMVMSLGWNPFYKNEKKTVEPHLIHKFDGDFYGQELRVVVAGYLRPELNFPSLEALITAIKTDIALAEALLDREPYAALGDDPFLKAS